MKRHLLLPVFLVAVAGLLPPGLALALDSTKAITQYVHDAWRVEQGLPQNSVFSLAKTSDGYLWFGTENGLVRFDGVRFTVFDRRNTPPLPEDYVGRLFADREGNLWILTRGRLTRLQYGVFTRVPPPFELPDGVLFPMAHDREGSLWFSSYAGLIRLKGGTYTRVRKADGLSHEIVSVVLEDLDGSLWIGTAGGGLNHLQGGAFKTYTTKDGLPNDRVRALCQGRDGSLWIGTRGGLSRLRDGSFTSWSKKDGLTGDVVNALLEDGDQNVWIATDGGLTRFRDGRLDSLATAGSTAGSMAESVTSLLEDAEGSLWFGTFGDGLHRLRDGKFTAFTAKEGLADGFVASLLEDRDGSVWMGTLLGLYRLKDGTFTRFTKRDGLSGESVYGLAQDREGSLWIGTSGGGLNRLKESRFTSFTTKDGLAGDHPRPILEDRDGSLWIGTEAGLSRLKDGGFTSFTTKDGLASDAVTALLEDRERSLWVGTEGGGLSRLRGGTFTTLTTKDGLASDALYGSSLVEDRDGILWVATSSGLNRIRDGRLAAFDLKEGPFHDRLYRVLDDDRGGLWTASNKGIYRIDKKGLNEFADGRSTRVSWTLFDTDDGLPIAEGSCCGRLKTRDGRLWFPTMKGVAVIDPARIRTNEVPPPAVVEEVLADGTLASRSGIAPLQLAPGTSKLEIHYTGLSFVVPRRVRFRYRLDGFDRDWVEAGTERVAHYTNLPPRSYTFRVIAANDDGVWNETGASLAITLLPRFWQTWWFHGLEGLALLGTFAGALLLQRRRLDTRKAVALRLADLDRKTEELEHARSVQLALLPKEPLTVGAWTVAGGMQTATEVGGDYYGYLEVGGRLCVVIGDATGHGMASGLVAGMLKSALAALSRTEVNAHAPARWLDDLNGALRASISQRGLGVCLGIGLVDVESGEVELGMAGVPHPFHVTASGRVERLQLSGTPLGYLKRLLPATATRTLGPGDRLVLITDGLIEQVNAAGEEWGYAGVEAALAAACADGAGPEEIAEELLAACERFGAGQPRSDDRTVVVLARRGTESRRAR